jgi:Holliday junction resolvasome RuvABC DNA-binding subunit
MNSDIQKIKLAILTKITATLGTWHWRKTAKRMILELKSKIEMEDISALGNSSSNKSSTISDPHPDAMEALLRLGYQRQQVSKTLRGMPTEIIEAEEVITYFLKNN